MQTVAGVIDLERIATPKEECLIFRIGTIDAGTLVQAEEFRFDHAPVLSKQGELLGVIPVAHVRELYSHEFTIEADDPAIRLRRLDDILPVLDFLEDIEQDRAVVIRDTNNQHDPDWFALVTISDLNRHAFRSHLYPLFAELEVQLAELIERTYDDPWEWLEWTGEDAKVTHVGRWILEQRNGVDTSPVTGCTLTDLLRVVSGSDKLRGMLGGISKNKFKDCTGSFPGLRNQIMHPVRPLILELDDVSKLRTRLSQVLELTDLVTAANSQLRHGTRAPLSFLP